MIELSLSIDEINKILEALGNRPYVEVFQLIDKIQQQAGSQLHDNGLSAPADSPAQRS